MNAWKVENQALKNLNRIFLNKRHYSIGDTEGVDADQENFEKVFNYLHMFKELHDYYFYLKQLNTFNNFFTYEVIYCISELFTQLHKSACKNIISKFSLPSRDAFFILKDFVKNELKISDLVLNLNRKFIYQMAEPMVDLSLNLETNIKHIQNQENELLDVNKDKLELARSLNILIDDLIMDKLPYPTTVCTANKCTTIIVKENGDQVTHYGTRCHEDCQLKGVANNVTGDRILENCWAMAGTGKCAKKCGCPFNFHRHIYYVTKIVKKNIIDKNQKLKIDSKEKAIEAIEKTIEQTKKVTLEMKQEIETIQKIGAKFAYLLLKHSNTAYNKFLEPYLKLLIREEEKKIGNKPSYSTDKLKSLEKMLKTHQSQVSFLVKAIKSNTAADVTIKEIGIMQKQLLV
ncbi:hypothetical protein TYRP_023744 [Tyrophagus putrescentiae]|nr:hypothetical protein TYRP_023744 [Tyrophagus putrescentiae]